MISSLKIFQLSVEARSCIIRPADSSELFLSTRLFCLRTFCLAWKKFAARADFLLWLLALRWLSLSAAVCYLLSAALCTLRSALSCARLLTPLACARLSCASVSLVALLSDGLRKMRAIMFGVKGDEN